MVKAIVVLSLLTCLFLAFVLIMARVVWAKRSRPLPSNRMGNLTPWVAEDAIASPREQFWALVGGYTGMIRMVYQLGPIVGMLQRGIEEGYTDHEKARQVWLYGLSEITWALLALPETVWCALIPQLPHLAARRSVRCHWMAAYRANTLLQTAPWMQPSSLL